MLRRAPTRYEARGRIAAGGMAEVWSADAVFETGERHPVAIKRVLPELAKNPLYLSLFEDEARLGMFLRHPNIVRVYDARNVGGAYIMVMELVEGVSLRTVLDSLETKRTPMPAGTALHIVSELLSGLAYAHTATDASGQTLEIVHRDVSPHNVLLSVEGGVKLTDFGLANAQTNRTDPGESMVGGKIAYLAPEIVSQKDVDHRIDIFAAGIVLWECVTARRLFQGKDDRETIRNIAAANVPPPSTIVKGLPNDVDRVCAALLARDPNQRPGDTAQVASAVARVRSRVDPRAGSDQVAALAKLYRAAPSTAKAPPVDLMAVARDLEAFAKEAGGSAYDMAAAPLDPNEF